MNATDALALQPGTEVSVPFGRTRRLDERATGKVVSVEDHGTWGPGMKPAGYTEDTPLVIVKVDLGRRRGIRAFGNGIVEVAK